MSKLKPKLAVVHDHLGWKGGGERTALLLAIATGADFITAYADENVFSDYQKELGGRFKVLTKNPVHTRGVRFFWLRSLFWKNRKLLSSYDILIASGQPATEAVSKYARTGATKILYNHTPPRRVFDLREESRLVYPKILRPVFDLFVSLWRNMYLRALDKMDFDICNSQTVKNRLIKFTGRNANAIVWPPILTDKFKYIVDGDYFISWARLDEAKRVELVIEAFTKMPDKKLIVASTGPREASCKKIAGSATNITFVGAVDDDELISLVGASQAAIYIPKDEDAGMTQLEANSAGKPVLGVAEGGLDETIINNVTGIKLPANPTVDDVINGVKLMTPAWCAEKKDACISHAQAFSYKEFAKKINEIVDYNNPSKKIIGIDASRYSDPRFPNETVRSGVEIYSWHLIDALINYFADKPYRLRLYVPRLIPNISPTIQKVIPPRRAWTLTGLKNELKNNPPDYFFTPAYFIPAYAPENSTAVIHDLAFEAHPMRYSFKDWFEQISAWSANKHRAKKLISVSAATLGHIKQHHKPTARKTVFVPPGFAGPETGTVPFSYGDSPRNKSIVYVGRIDKKKSVQLLVEAFFLVAEKYEDWHLDLVGSDGLGATELKSFVNASPLKDRITFHGYASEEKKFAMLSKASIFVQSGSAEGSALSLLEAWDTGTPSIVADIPVMREIGKNAVLYFKPEDKNNLVEQISKLIESKDLQESLPKLGQAELKNFSWEKTAEEIGKIILQ